MQDYLYVHYDGISNSVLTKGMDRDDFQKYTSNQPESLVLLNTNEQTGEFEPHTGFNILRGNENVKQYFDTLEEGEFLEVKWIDFNEYDMLKRLTPNEISELLYFGHMKNHLRSPFFFKLQNNFAFFELAPKTIKIYYRNIEDFYELLSKKISSLASKRIEGRPSLFKKRKNIEIPNVKIDIIRELKGTMQEGIVFNFSQVSWVNNEYIVPMHVVEDNLRKVDNYHFKKEYQIGTLIYSSELKEWRAVREEFDSILSKT